MSGAYYEKIARINLTTGEIKVEQLDLDMAHKFIGGRGLGTKMLYDEGIATVEPLSPENKLIYLTGPMTGSNSPSSGRYMVLTKSPLTGMIACSNSGGIWGAKLKFAGWDGIVVEGKAEWVKIFQDLTAVIDSMGNCLFISFALGAQEYADLLNAATGTNYNTEELLEIGERIYNIERMFNKAAGMKPEDDRLPKRLLEEPISNGPSKGMVSRLPETLPLYYQARGWVNAFPTDETLKKLGLDECVGK